MPDVKWIDPTEFREAGFLQEANRLFFHPHGLALAVTTIKGEDNPPVRVLALNDEQAGTLLDILKAVRETPDPVGPWSDNALGALVEAVESAAPYENGESYFQGCWDYRDDPEGVIFGSWHGQDVAKVERVAAQREKHRETRTVMFGEGSDVEHIGFVYEEVPDADA